VSRNLESVEIEGVPLDGDAETVSAQIAGRSASRLLSDIHLDPSDPVAHLVAYLMLRMHEMSIEKDEIAVFAEANRAILSAGVLDEADRVIGATSLADENFALWGRRIIDDIRLSLSGCQEFIERRSDRLLWLCMALAWQVANGKLAYRQACEVLNRPHNRRRIDRISLKWMIDDTAESSEDWGPFGEFVTEYTMLIAEGCLLLGETVMVWGAFKLLRYLPPAADAKGWTDVVERCAQHFAAANALGADERSFLGRVHARFGAQISDDDL
jgi:hypothetical protein